MAELLHPAFEEYCEAIYELREDDLSVIQARIAERIGVSRPAVSEMIRRMTSEGLVRTTKGTVSLTESGRGLAEQVVRRHRLAERFLTDILGLSWAEAHHEAGKWEHVLSAPVEAAINRLLNDPTTCPHGNPIPGSHNRFDTKAHVALADATPGAVTVARISEKLELDKEALALLASSDLIPGRDATVTGRGTDGITVRTAKGDHTVPDRLARLMWVTPAA